MIGFDYENMHVVKDTRYQVGDRVVVTRLQRVGRITRVYDLKQPTQYAVLFDHTARERRELKNTGTMYADCYVTDSNLEPVNPESCDGSMSRSGSKITFGKPHVKVILGGRNATVRGGGESGVSTGA